DGLLSRGRIEKLGTKGCFVVLEHYGGSDTGEGVIIERERITVKDVKHAIKWALNYLLKEGFLQNLGEIVCVGHRVVHGAEKYKQAVLVDKHVRKDIDRLSKFAPLHNPHNLDGIQRCTHLFKHVPQVAVFDTAFHQTLPEKAYLYGISPEFHDKYGIRKYGFHGTNHKYCALKAAELLKHMPKRMITCHLGNGSSVTAVKNGQSVDTSMGFTPTDGLIMGTRSGALDPEVVLYLLRELKAKPAKIDEFLNKESGLLSIAGTSDVRELWERAVKGDKSSTLALDMLGYEITRYIGAYAAALNGLDCLVFTGGIGENAWYVRSEACNNLGHLGIMIDTDKNQKNEHIISTPDSKVTVFVLKANEELQIAREAAAVWKENQ
ncbi:acetate/propionate family kinase, partial [Candidatus Woesearchaeota archaeon]|nr:acetate/propionate family kinase [Candidatus Woesearchaeota archaeon]